MILLDFAKGLVPTLVAVKLESDVAGIAAGAAAMAGHWRPLFLGFARGGKLIATGGGVFFALAPLVAVTAVAVWLVFFAAFRYASVASLAASLFVPVGAWIYGYPTSVAVLGVATFASIAYLHRANLQRLRRGAENRSSIDLTGWIRRSRPARP